MNQETKDGLKDLIAKLLKKGVEFLLAWARGVTFSQIDKQQKEQMIARQKVEKQIRDKFKKMRENIAASSNPIDK